MKQITLRGLSAALFSTLALLAVASCSSKPAAEPTSESSSSTMIESGVPGGTVVDTFTMTANVTNVDAARREVTLATPDGKKQVVKCGPQVVNFDQIYVGDQLKVTVTEELAVHMADDGAAGGSPLTGAAALVELAPKGARPGGVLATTVQEVATVTAIDAGRHRATLRFSDGTLKTIPVRSDVDLTQRKVGEKVVIRVTNAMALAVEKP